jgi:bifunctional non-homologous end joining protein LigD
MPDIIYPALATLVAKPPVGNDWLHEIKFDGYRLISFIKDNKIKLITRGQQDWTKDFPHLVQQLKKLRLGNAILDGEIVMLNKDQHSDFQLLQNRLKNKNTRSIVYYVFDLLYVEGKNVMSLPLIERKAMLAELLANADQETIRYSDHVQGKGEQVFQKARQLKLEGIVSKLASSPYLQKRTQNWRKIKYSQRQEFVVGGFTKPRGTRTHFGSLLIGVFNKKGQLQYCGHVGTGFTATSLKSMSRLLAQYQTDKMPFATQPPQAQQVTWVKPVIVIEVEFSGWTQENILRHPAFKGIRQDKQAKAVEKEMPEKIAVKSQQRSSIKREKSMSQLTHPEKLLYPDLHITKLDLAEFYSRIQDWILPYLIKRPLTVVRCPQADFKKCFFQKHLEKSFDGLYFYIENVEGLLALVQLDVLEFHPWQSRVDKIEKPDMLIFDIDPAPDVSWKEVVRTAFLMRDELKELDLISFVKTTGGKGLHVVVPIKRLYTWEQVKLFSQTFVTFLVKKYPESYVGTMSKSKRTGKIFIDYFRNMRGATAVCAYSTRAKPTATVSVPIHWGELKTNIKSDSFDVKNLMQRLDKLKEDPWEDFFQLQQTLKMG